MAAGCIPMLVRLSSSPNGELRLNAVWALQNLVYTASSDVRKAILAAISWQHVQALADDIRSDIQVRLLCLPAVLVHKRSFALPDHDLCIKFPAFRS